MGKIRVKTKKEKRIYIHNDILNAAYHLKEHVAEKEGKDETGITLHIMGALSMYAFAYEAQINFLGHKCVSNWNEREPFHVKSKKIFDKFSINQNPEQRPYSTVNNLKEFRDFIAHGKPVETSEEYEEIIEQEQDDFDQKLLDRDYYQFCTVEQLNNVAEDIDEIWSILLRCSGLSHFETITTSSGGKTFIGYVDGKT